MYVDNDWTPVQGEELSGFLDQINPVDNKYKVSAQSTLVHWRMLPFYENVALIRVHDPAWLNPRLNIYFLTEEGELFRLNGTSPPIHEVNAKAPVKITEENVLDYLRFFCFFVRGEDGPFLIVEDMDNPWLPSNLDDKTRVALENTIRPASFEGKNDQGFFMCNAVVYYSNALFLANFAVQPGGMIEMIDDEPVATDLPSRVDAPVG